MTCSLTFYGSGKNNPASGAGVAKTSATAPASTPAAAAKTASLWQISKNRNEFDGYTAYTITLRGPQKEFLFLGYEKNDVPSKSLVRAGSSGWPNDSIMSPAGTYDFKTEKGDTISKKYTKTAKWSPTTGWKNDKNSFYFTYDSSESVKFWLQLFEENNFLTVRYNSKHVRRFQTAAFWEALAQEGITKDEIYAAVANEEA